MGKVFGVQGPSLSRKASRSEIVFDNKEQDLKKSMTARFRFRIIFRMKKIHKIQNDIMNEI